MRCHNRTTRPSAISARLPSKANTRRSTRRNQRNAGVSTEPGQAQPVSCPTVIATLDTWWVSRVLGRHPHLVLAPAAFGPYGTTMVVLP